MTEETKLKSQELLERTHAAREELDALTAEQRRFAGDLERARVEDHEERMKAVRSGGSIRSAVSSWVSRAWEVEGRREALPELIWTARMYVLELEAEYNRARHAELGEELPGAQAEFREVDALLPEVQKRRERALDHANYLNRELRDLERRRETAQEELEALKRSGPEWVTLRAGVS